MKLGDSLTSVVLNDSFFCRPRRRSVSPPRRERQRRRSSSPREVPIKREAASREMSLKKEASSGGLLLRRVQGCGTCYGVGVRCVDRFTRASGAPEEGRGGVQEKLSF